MEGRKAFWSCTSQAYTLARSTFTTSMLYQHSLTACHTLPEDYLTDVTLDIQAPYFSRRRSYKDAGDGAEAYCKRNGQLRDNHKLSQAKS
jgi:hypothetical protein